jgi:hypothetical protein
MVVIFENDKFAWLESNHEMLNNLHPQPAAVSQILTFKDAKPVNFSRLHH